jgi:multidrug efflux pump subunit AcrA (membrane-fusion protein)
MTSRSKKISLAVGAGVLLLGAIAWGGFGGGAPQYELEDAARGDIVETVSVTGSVKPQQKIELQAEVSGRVTRLPFAEGAVVKPGDVLLQLDSRDILARIASQRAAVDAAAVRLRELQAGATPQELAVTEAAVASARAKVEASIVAQRDAREAFITSELNLETAKAKADLTAVGARQDLASSYADAAADASDAVFRLTAPLFVTDEALSFTANSFEAESAAKRGRVAAKAAQQRIAAAAVGLTGLSSSAQLLAPYGAVRADLEVIKTYVEACSALLNFTIGLSSSTLAQYRLDADTALTAINGASSQLTSAATSLSLAEHSSEFLAAQSSHVSAQTNLNVASNNVIAAQSALAQAEAELSLKQAGTRKETVDGQRAQLAGAQGTLSSLYAELAKRSLLAPVAGTVTLVDVRLGETVQPGRAAVAMNATGAFAIEVNISEVDVGKVQVGDKAAITLDAFPGEAPLTGHVATVNPSEKVVDGIIFYKTTVVFDGEDARLKSGMTANLDIETGRATGVVRVPLRAVKERDGKRFVEVLVAPDAQPQEREVVLGLEETEYAEAKSGLAEGEAVVVGTLAN